MTSQIVPLVIAASSLRNLVPTNGFNNIFIFQHFCKSLKFSKNKTKAFQQSVANFRMCYLCFR